MTPCDLIRILAGLLNTDYFFARIPSSVHALSCGMTLDGRMKSGCACYHSVKNLLSSSLLSKNIKIQIHKTVSLPVL